MFKKTREIARGKSEINITPLVDIVLVLLIIFMVITPIVQRGFDGQLPSGKAPKGPPIPSIVLQIAADGTLRINKEVVPETDLGDKLHAIFSTRPEEVLFVAVEDSVRYQDMIRVLDICRMPGRANGIAFILD
jgi:biopolymer transport protein ExbD